MTKHALLIAAAVIGFIPSAYAAPDQTADLAAKITTTYTGTEKFAMNAGFPRPFVIAEIAKAVLVTVDAAEAPGPVEKAALDQVLTTEMSTQAQAALKIVRHQVEED